MKDKPFLNKFLSLLILGIFCCIACPGYAWSKPVRINLMVDNSGSMYGKCSRDEACQDIMPEVKRALSIVLEMLHAYNQRRPADQQLELILTVFGGQYNGAEEFEEIKLSPDIKQSLATLNQRLVPLKTNFYQDTNFSLAFRKASDLLKSRGKADLTIFLTDAVKSGASEGGGSIDLSGFGATYLYSLMQDMSSLTEWKKHFEAQNIHAETIHIEKGWQILSSFVTVFVKFLIPEGQDQYLSYEEQELPSNKATLQITKLSNAKATYYVIFHGSETPQLEKIEFEGALLEQPKFSSHSGINLLTVELEEGTPSGQYTILLKPMQQNSKSALIGLEDVSLILVDRLNPPGKQNVYKRNEEVSFHFGFASPDHPEKLILNDAQQKAFLELAHLTFEAQEQSGKDLWTTPVGQKETKYVHQFHPSGKDDAVYNIMTAWSYLEKSPKATDKAGTFLISKHAGQELALNFTSKHGELWQGLDIQAQATFPQPSSLTPPLQQLSQITLRDQQSNTSFVLKKIGQEQVFQGNLGRLLEQGRHTFELVEPLQAGDQEILLTGKELTIKPRLISLTLKESFSRQSSAEEGFLRKLLDGFKYLWGQANEGGLTHKTEEVSLFPLTHNVLIQYYDKDEYQLEVQGKMEPVFSGERLNIGLNYQGPTSYTAEHVYTPGFMGLFQGKAQQAKDALKIDITPDPSQIKVGDTFKLSIKKGAFDWEIREPLTPKPELNYRFELSEGDEKISFTPASVVLDIKTRPYDKEIITGLRWFAFLALLGIALLLLGLILILAIMYRAHILQRQELCEEILKRVPWDFCDTGPNRGKCVFPDESRKLLREEVLKRRVMKPALVLREAIENHDPSFLKKVWQTFKLSQLRELLAQCKSKNLTSDWEFEVSAGSVINIFGPELNTSINAIRLREDDLPQVVGNFKVQQAKGSGLADAVLVVRFSPNSHLVVKHNDKPYFPIIKEDIEVKYNDVLYIGPNINQLKIKMVASLTGNTLVVASQEL